MKPGDFRSTKAGKAIRTKNGYWAFIPAPLPPNLDWSPALLTALSDAERELAKLTTVAGSFPFPRLLIQPFIRREAVLSSRIEGTRASLTDLYNYESAQMSFLESDDDVREVHNYVLALDYGLERLQKLPVSQRLIRELHAKLMDGVRGGQFTPGEFRKTQNWIGAAGSTIETATYVPPPVDEMKIALGAMEVFIHADTELPALVRAGLIHYQFEAIHPFLDGNGRVGRLLIMLLLREWGVLSQPLLNLSAYFEHYRQEYYDHLLAVSQHGKWEEWLRFFLRGISAQAQDSIFRMTRLQGIRTQYEELVQADNNPQRMSAVIDFLFSRPILTLRQLETALDIPYMAAKRYVDKLVEAGVLKETTGYARNRVFMAYEVFQALENTE
ncbi:MAG TPA: Fic family protein [Anaerolineales bacterium]|mgnify:CR=1 FL=1|nr:cell filamentation protein Fic [Anaerolineae bacterium]HRJ55793.1 Fic family protein [Anaerolineales bacterium]HRK88045.1 Fic family protein [Anaerolineales bacterium]